MKLIHAWEILNTLFLSFLAEVLFFMQLFHKILNGLANSVDPDALFAHAILSGTLVYKILGYLPYIESVHSKISRHW